MEQAVTRKKLIEVALPLEAINAASAREKSIRHGHPSTLHPWWARRPLATARAVLFAQMVDDPSSRPELFPTEEDQSQERQRLFRIIEELVKWENTTNETILEVAREEIRRSWRRTCEDNRDHPRAAELFDPDRLPAFHDPFAGGGSIPLEAQRLGLEAHASDLNPVAVLINKAMIEIPPRFAGRPPVNPEARKGRGSTEAQWKGAAGLAEDVRYYGKWMRDEAEKRIGHLYPKIEVTAEMAQERPDLKPYVGPQADRHRLALGPHRQESQPRLRRRGRAIGFHFRPLHQDRQGSLRRAGHRERRLPLQRQGWPSAGLCEERHQDGKRQHSGVSLPDVLGPIPFEYIDCEANAGRMGSG